jgi:hypothetical protein
LSFVEKKTMRPVSGTLPRNWRDITIVALALLLAVSPWLLGYADLPAATWNAVVVGAVLGAGAAAVIVWRPYWPDFIVAFFAFWLAMGPRILGYDDRWIPTILADAIGVVVIVLALWSVIVRARELRESGETAGSPRL